MSEIQEQSDDEEDFTETIKYFIKITKNCVSAILLLIAQSLIFTALIIGLITIKECIAYAIRSYVSYRIRVDSANISWQLYTGLKLQGY